MESVRHAIIVSLIVFSSVCFGQQAATSPQAASVSEANAVQSLAFPFIAEITADDVYIRSGPGQNYYFCGKLNKGDKVKVVASKFSWSQIVAPQGSFSWISKQYVQVDPANKQVGTVLGDAVRVYAGSDVVAPMNSTSMQLKLNKGEKVSLLGEERDGYYKIAPPEGAYLWANTELIWPLASLVPSPMPNVGGAANPPPAQVQPEKKTELKPSAKPAVTPAQPSAAGPNGVSSPIAASGSEDDAMKKYNDLKTKVTAERAKPVQQQNYTEIKKGLTELANNKQAGRAAGYASYALKQIDRFELAKKIGETAKEQDEQSAKAQQDIERARQEKLAGVKDDSRFVIMGTLQTSNVLGKKPTIKYFRIVDDSGKTVAYAIPTGPAEILDFSQYLDKKVGLVGVTEPFIQTGSVLVKFSEIAEIK